LRRPTRHLHFSLAARRRTIHSLRRSQFWKVHVYSLQTSLFIIVGRILDEASDAHSIHNLLNATLSHIDIFSKEALSARKVGNGLSQDLLDNFMGTAWFPNGAADLRHLKRELVPYANNFKQIYRPIRNSIFAHKIEIDEKQVSSLFAPTDREELGAILNFLFDLMHAIEDLYLNGRSPELGTRYEYIRRHNQRIRDNVKSFLYKVAVTEGNEGPSASF
jgi:hypothetical protein